MTPRRHRGWVWAAGTLTCITLAVWAYQHFNLGQWLTLEQLRTSRDGLVQAYQARPLQTVAVFFVVYVAAAALSIPGAVVLTLAAGAMFGLGLGLLVVSFASSLGALLAFWVSRHLLRQTVQQRFARALAPINEGMARDGAFYLLTLRLVPVFPFWLVNLLMGLTPLSAARFYVVSQLGMLAGTAVYVNAGTQLAALRSPADVLNPALWGSFLLLGAFPWVAKALAETLRRRRLYAAWQRPRRFDRNLVVVGAGAGGLVSAYIGAAVKAKVTLVEGHRMGGDCLNTGCVPSKALLRSASLAQQMRQAHTLGLVAPPPEVDFAAVMARVQRVIADVAPHDSVERYTGLGVEVLQGRAHIVDPWTVDTTLADGSVKRLTTRHIVVASGAAPRVPDLPGLHDTGFLTSDTLWNLRRLPRRLVVLGGGPIGCELAQAFARLGAQVTQVEAGPRLLPREDADAAAEVQAGLQRDGVHLLLGHRALRAGWQGGDKCLWVQPDGPGAAEQALPFDELLCAVGRSPRVSGFGLEALGLLPNAQGTLDTNAWLQTKLPNIFAVGDVAGPYQFTHVAAHQAWHAVVNALFGAFKRFKVDYRFVPHATFTAPELARVGLSEAEAQAQGVAYERTRYNLDDLDRAIADGTTQGFVKVLTVPGRDRILGVTIVGAHAGELLAEYVLAMKHGLGLNQVLATIHTYPTLAEANKAVAGVWKRAHAPQGLLAWLEKFHAWQRG